MLYSELFQAERVIQSQLAGCEVIHHAGLTQHQLEEVQVHYDSAVFVLKNISYSFLILLKLDVMVTFLFSFRKFC